MYKRQNRHGCCCCTEAIIRKPKPAAIQDEDEQPDVECVEFEDDAHHEDIEDAIREANLLGIDPEKLYRSPAENS